MTDSEKFSNLTADEDTTILQRQLTQIRGFDIMVELWIWDGIQGQSAIFSKKDIENIPEDELIILIKEHFKTETVTISRINPEFVFLNFNFLPTK